MISVLPGVMEDGGISSPEKSVLSPEFRFQSNLVDKSNTSMSCQSLANTSKTNWRQELPSASLTNPRQSDLMH